MSIFSSIIAQTARIPSSRCCSFLKKARDTFASYSLSYLVNSGQVTGIHLDSLGICFASNIPSQRLSTLSVADFISRISYFTGHQAQYDTVTANVISILIANAVGTYTLDNLMFNILLDAALYTPNFNGITTVNI